MIKTIFKNKITYLVLLSFGILLLWWFEILFKGVREQQENYLFGFAYAGVALIGGINGLYISKRWGGWKSLVGKGIIFFSLGLLGEFFGQTAWSYYNVIAKLAVPYPSIADIGYFSIIPFYSLGMICFARAAGAKFTLKTMKGKSIAIIIPVIMVTVSYFLFLRNIKDTFTLVNALTVFLDYGYPVGEAITISIALTTYLLSRKLLGGKMKNRILFLIFALIAQYITDTTFLYQATVGTYYNAGIVDLMYLSSFAIMSLGLISLTSYE